MKVGINCGLFIKRAYESKQLDGRMVLKYKHLEFVTDPGGSYTNYALSPAAERLLRKWGNYHVDFL